MTVLSDLQPGDVFQLPVQRGDSLFEVSFTVQGRPTDFRPRNTSEARGIFDLYSEEGCARLLSSAFRRSPQRQNVIAVADNGSAVLFQPDTEVTVVKHSRG